MPGDTCLNFLRGTCTYRDKCWFRHDVAAGRCIGSDAKPMVNGAEVRMVGGNKKLGVIDASAVKEEEPVQPLLYADPTVQRSTASLNIHHAATSANGAVSLTTVTEPVAAAARREARKRESEVDREPQVAPDNEDLRDFPVLGTTPERGVRWRPAVRTAQQQQQQPSGDSFWDVVASEAMQGQQQQQPPPPQRPQQPPPPQQQHDQPFWEWASADAGWNLRGPQPPPLRRPGIGRILERITVRATEDLTSTAVAVLEVGQEVEAEELCGPRLRIVRPVPGWVTVEVQGTTYVMDVHGCSAADSGRDAAFGEPPWIGLHDGDDELDCKLADQLAEVMEDEEEETVQRRVDDVDGRAYTLEEFIAEYGGTRDQPPPQWQAAPTPPKGSALLGLLPG
eukprot:TRINITY_DN2648_c1_g1_i1.p1 TRINITY_DN2648_c1_g1~~TRINITY_DN2648_c1_g1_i1.p1  ORF type:complete len:443 (+),score=92.34 TRINITY_DN2648_c1_g1_i1:149-1330(+)